MRASRYHSCRALLFPIAFLMVVSIFTTAAFGQGVAILNATAGEYLTLSENDISIAVEGQVALVTSRQTFKNDFNGPVTTSFAFPMPEGASATGLRWQVDGTWYFAEVSPTPQDTMITEPGGSTEIAPGLKLHLGETPLYFDIEESIPAETDLIVELTYVELLPYEFGVVDVRVANNYEQIQSSLIGLQRMRFELTSPRTIENVLLTTHSAVSESNDGATAVIEYATADSPANADYHIQYSLSLDELGLFGFSTLLDEEDRPDESDRGFFASVIEPESGDSDTIDKVFTLIIDRSGSMRGSKMVQARNAASFIVQNLNEGDRFNIVSFDNSVLSFRDGHVDFTEETRREALSYIGALVSGGSTNISDAFATAIPQFASSSNEVANLIVFFTDGEATAGIRSTEGIVAEVDRLKAATETDPIIFTFGIGESVDRQLLTLLASGNDGLAEFLGSDELEDRISQFYLRIRNPVVLNTQISFDPPVVSEVFPRPLPGLYKGQQVVVGGRYSEAGTVKAILRGTAFGKDVEFAYDLELSNEADPRYQFLTKVWAKLKISDLLVQYYLEEETSLSAQELRRQIRDLSVAFGVLSPFSSFVSGGEQPTNDEEELPEIAPGIEVTGNFPNPFTDGTTITIRVTENLFELVFVKIYDSLGRLVQVLPVQVNGAGEYQVYWDGMSRDGLRVPAGTYVYTIVLGDVVVADAMTRL